MTRHDPPAAERHSARAGEPTPFRSRIESVGVELPEKRRTTSDLVASCRHRHRVDLERLTGIHERRVCGEGEDSYSLAVNAALDCLSRSRYEPQDLEMLISCSITTFEGLELRVEPAFSLLIREAVGASRALHFDVRNACAGMITGVYILDDFIRRGVVRCGMVVSGEYITNISDNAERAVRTILSKQLASLTVGDCGAAVILEQTEPERAGIEACQLATYAAHSGLCLGGPCRTGPGGEMFTDARKLHKVAIESASPTIRASLDEAGLSARDLDFIIPHQTSVRAIRQGMKRIAPSFGVSADDYHIVYNLEDYGNTASTTHFLAFQRYLEEGRFAPGDCVELMVFASGVVCGSVILRMDELCETHGRRS